MKDDYKEPLKRISNAAIDINADLCNPASISVTFNGAMAYIVIYPNGKREAEEGQPLSERCAYSCPLTWERLASDNTLDEAFEAIMEVANHER